MSESPNPALKTIIGEKSKTAEVLFEGLSELHGHSFSLKFSEALLQKCM
jgi:hypothetical protein